MARIHNDITETIGNTPLVRLHRTAAAHGAHADILLKLEFFNPLSSVKDRIGLAMIDDALKSGKITKDSVIIEPTSGNTGIALAFVAAAKGLKLILTMPETMSTERKKLLKILGARVVLTEGAKGIKGAIAKAEELAARIPHGIILQQFVNPANPAIHRRTTAEEIWRDTDGQVDIIVAGIGTGGTITGIGEVLKPRKAALRIVAVEPDASPVLSGGQPGPHKLQGIGAGFVPGVLNPRIYDEVIRVKEADSGAVSKQVNQLDGIPVGISSGCGRLGGPPVGQAPREQGQADRGDHPVQLGTLPLHLVVCRRQWRERLGGRPHPGRQLKDIPQGRSWWTPAGAVKRRPCTKSPPYRFPQRRMLLLGGLIPAVEAHAEGQDGHAHADELHHGPGEQLVGRGGQVGDPRGEFVGRIEDVGREGDVGEDRGHGDEHGGQVEHLPGMAGGRKLPRWAQQGPPIEEGRAEEHEVFGDVHRAVLEREVVELRQVPDGQRDGVDGAADHGIGQDAQDRLQGRSAGDGAHQPVRQAEQEEDGGRVEDQLVLQHVGAEQEAFAGLIKGRADGEVEDDQGRVKHDGLAAGVGLARREALAPRPRQNGIEPPEEDEPADEEGFIVPVGPVDHGWQKSLREMWDSGNQEKEKPREGRGLGRE
jgi:cysteine synthase A